ncbi:MAG: T9SS type A sorting domain-containing protein [Bacteroidales bacterium]|nr:T9SS type A sorting domain-containing protein [Bacteroidales bacterium]
MKKVLLLSATFFMFLFTANAQVIYEDDFDSYTVGGYLAEQSAEWTTWSGAPGGDEDGIISDDQAMSGSNSVLVEDITDLVLPLGNKTSGRYEVSFYYYVPSGFGGYYNIQHYEQPGIEWAMECYFDDDGTGYIHAGGENAATFAYTMDAWVEVVNIIDLNNDNAELYIEGNFIHSWQFSLTSDGEPGELQLGGMNHYAGATSGMTAKYYFDDYNYEQLPVVLFFDDMESYNAGEYLAEQSDWWTTWSSATGGDEDALISDAQAYSPTNSALVEGVTDLVGPFGNKTSGVYEVNFYIYVPSGFGGYYNIQHFEQPGIEWAYEVYFFELDEGILTVGGEDYSFFYNHDEWVYVENDIDLDADWAEVYIDGTLVHEFQFSQQANSNEPGTLQLGGIDIFAGAQSGETPMFYFDDFEWTELSAPSDPLIAVDPTSMSAALEEGQTEDQMLTVENVGFADLEFDVDIIYDLDSKKTSAPAPAPTTKIKSIVLDIQQMPNPKPGPAAPARDDVTLTYAGDPAGGIGLTDGGIWEVAARFPNDMIVQYAGMELTSMDVHINEDADNFQARIYGEGMNNQAGDLLTSQNFTPILGDWVNIELDDPVVVTGEDLWVGYMINQTQPGTFPAGNDEGPADPNGDWIKSGVAWTHLSSNPDLNYNWTIKGYLTGTAMPNWLSVAPEAGTVAPGESEELTVTFDGTGLDNGSYFATMEINSNDPNAPITEVEAMLDIVTGVNEYGENNGILIYPNPVQDHINIQANHEVTNIRIVNYVGQLVYENNNPNELTKVITSDFTNGMYIIQVETTAGTSNHQIVVR